MKNSIPEIQIFIAKITREFNINGKYSVYYNYEKDSYDIFIDVDNEDLIYFYFKDKSIFDVNGNYIDINELYKSNLQLSRTYLASELLLNFFSYNDFFLHDETLEFLEFEINLENKLSDNNFEENIGYNDYEGAFMIINNYILENQNNHFYYKIRSNLLLQNDFTERAIKDLVFSLYLNPTNISNVFDVFYRISILYKDSNPIKALIYIVTLESKIRNYFATKNINVIEFRQTSFDIFDTKSQEQENTIELINVFKKIIYLKSTILSISSEYAKSNILLLELSKISYDIKYLFEMGVNFYKMEDFEFSTKLFNDVINFKNGVYQNIGIDTEYIKMAKEYLKK